MKSRIFKDPMHPYCTNISVGVDDSEVLNALDEEEILHRVRHEIAMRISDELWPRIKRGLDTAKDT